MKTFDRSDLEAEANDYLDTCYAGHTAARVSEFAERLGLSPSHLSRVFHALVGLPARDYLRRRQIALAQRLLRTTALPVDGIAVASAFGTPSSFYRCFGVALRMTPTEYRRMHSKA